MKLFKLDLLTLLISLFILSGCEQSDEVGLAVDSANAIKGDTTSAFNISTTTIRDSSVKTNLLTKFPLGYFNDPIFGVTDAKVSMSLSLPNDNLTFGTAPVLDSAILVLDYANEFYGDSTSVFDFEVHQLSEQIVQSSNFLNTAAHPFQSAIIGSRSATINTKDSVKITLVTKGKLDPKKNQPPQIRIPLTAAYIKNRFLNANVDSFKTNALFNDHIKGLYVTAKQQGTKAGGIVLLDLISGGSKLELYYKNTNGAKVDTNVTSFSITNSTPAVAGTFTHNYTGTEVKTQITNAATEYNYNFIQPLAGVSTKVNFTDFNTVLNKLAPIGHLSVNKAELVVSVITLPGDIFKPAPRLFLYTTDIAGQRKLIPDIDPTDPRVLPDVLFGGFYNKAKNNYKFNITAYVQDLLRDTKVPFGLYISSADPNVEGKLALNPTKITTGRVVIGSGAAGAPGQMKLNIIYTK